MCSAPALPSATQGCCPLARFPPATWCGLPIGRHRREDFPVRPARARRGLPGRPAHPPRIRTARSAGTAWRGFPAARTPGRRGEGSHSGPDPCAPRGTGWGQGEEVSPRGGRVPDAPLGLPDSPAPGRPAPESRSGTWPGRRERGSRGSSRDRAAALPPAPSGRPGRHSPGLHGGHHAAPGPLQGAAGRASASCTGPPAATSPGPAPRHRAGRQGAGRGGAGARPGGSEGGRGRGGVCPAPRPAPREGLGPGMGGCPAAAAGDPPGSCSPRPLVRAQGLRPGRL